MTRLGATGTRLMALLAAGLLLRLALLALVHNPGLPDAVHYYNLGRRLAQGQGLTIDYIWHYSRLPDAVEHPIDHWMPLAGAAAGLGISIAGDDARAALSVFLLAGMLLPLLTFASSKQLGLRDSAALTAAAFAAFLPDLVWNSLRTDTTVLSAIFAGAALLLLNQALRSRRRALLLICGLCCGLAYLTRNDALLLLPVIALTLLLHTRLRPEGWSMRGGVGAMLLVVAGFALLATPWLMRNQSELGMLGTAETSRMFFMAAHSDHYAYGEPITWGSLLERQTLQQLIGKRVFELLAALKQIAVSHGAPLSILTALGGCWLLRRRDRGKLLTLSPALLWMILILIAYPILLPYKSQAGSFEKAFLTILPLTLPLAALGFERLTRRLRWRTIALAAILLWLLISSVTFVRDETAKADLYYHSIGILVDALHQLPDRNGDGQLRLMSQGSLCFQRLRRRVHHDPVRLARGRAGIGAALRDRLFDDAAGQAIAGRALSGPGDGRALRPGRAFARSGRNPL